eukprot:TRINITY_DN3758_c0_g1_i1.p1 TRINITY_DN3758_c0_g1~~TRINITY_DN3758_c0_g1_i1.p1  ORF type:complete len:1027 (+),score=257.85 TRINITY_DN3758_c0_g1_i1:62-3142(+)
MANISPLNPIFVVDGTESPMRTPQRVSANFFEDLDSPEASPGSTRLRSVQEEINRRGLIHPDKARREVVWFFNSLGLDDYYFRTVSDESIASHILSIYSAKILAETAGDSFNLRIHNEHPEDALYIVPSFPGILHTPSQEVEYRFELNYLGEGYSRNRDLAFMPCPSGYRVQVYRTSGTVSEDSNMHLRFYFLESTCFPSNASKDEAETDLKKIADVTLNTRVSDHTRSIFQEMIVDLSKSLGPVTRVYYNSKMEEVRLLVAYRHGTTHSFFSGISSLYHSYGLYSLRKYIERFSNGAVIFNLDLKKVENTTTYPDLTLEQRANLMMKEVNMIYILPRSSLTPMFLEGHLTASEVAYAYSGWKFVHQFLNSFDSEYAELLSTLSKDSHYTSLLTKLRTRLRDDALSEDRVKEVIMAHGAIIRELYTTFALSFDNPKKDVSPSTYDYQPIISKIRRSAENELTAQVLLSFVIFNKHILKTNFFKSNKTALSFRLDPSFLSKQDYSVTPFAVNFVIGAEFRGFHVRFDDVARGGIRIIRSGSKTQFNANVSSLFQENYNLAYTQKKKNKDIPESGSKGTVLLSLDHQDKSLIAFRKYVDAILDLLLPNDEMFDYYGKTEILFLGPDEGTADFMDWASERAKQRGASFWKAFTTGKSPSRGGIPHDLYGMTTRSVHQYVLGILSKLGIDEASCTKFQTGGPDGDLGSNEIKISKDATIGIVDGSGVLYDPQGIDRTELTRLADQRKMVKFFDTKKLGPNGFLVLIEESNRTLPDGTLMENGLIFRNNFHLTKYASADIFVPCGGRPEAVNLSNVHLLFDPASGKPNFKYIVEGANLFFSAQAREKVEAAGVVLYKDSSANKGGVTSSSLEVLAALALTDEEFAQHMMVKDGVIPPFYREYVEEVQEKIEENARLEFECIWTEAEKSKQSRSLISDQVSAKINNLNDAVKESVLWNDENLRKRILIEAAPKKLLSLIGYDNFAQRVPQSYLQAIFGAYLASRYVYKMGLDAAEFAFFTFIRAYVEKPKSS